VNRDAPHIILVSARVDSPTLAKENNVVFPAVRPIEAQLGEALV
jgi:hypothetical protein